MEAFITYEGLPKGAHNLTKMGFEKAYSETKLFLETFTNGFTPTSISLIFYSSQNRTYRTLPHIWKLSRKFGFPKYECWNLITTKQRVFTWQLNLDEIEHGLQLLNEYENLPPNEYGPLTLALVYPFRFINPETKELIANQDKIPQLDFRLYNSHIHLRLGQRTTLFAWFAFPFSDYKNEGADYITSVFRELPFKPSPNGWRKWSKTKKGTWKSEKMELNSS